MSSQIPLSAAVGHDLPGLPPPGAANSVPQLELPRALGRRSCCAPELLDGASGAGGRLLESEQATAILCGSDLLAMAALRECRARGVCVRDEVSLVGFGDSLLARCSAPALTSVRVSAEEIGVRTTEALMLLLGGGTPSPVELPLKLVIRESTGPVPA